MQTGGKRRYLAYLAVLTPILQFLGAKRSNIRNITQLNTKNFEKRVRRRQFQDGIFFTQSPPESTSHNGTRTNADMRRKNLGAGAGERSEPVFERYSKISLDETAHFQPLGPKGEVSFVCAGKIT